MSIYYFCTYFDSNYLSQGLALYYSLKRHSSSFILWVLCMDDLSSEILSRMNLPNMRLISIQGLETGDEPLQAAKKNRSLIEYYFTCTPSLLSYILNKHEEVDIITYLDADLFFFGSPEPIYEELGQDSILIIEHRFPPYLRSREVFGIYNVGLLSFRRDEPGLECLRHWKDNCIEWCYDRVEGNRFADQKYLNEWPNRYSGVCVLQHKGVGLAPWNIGNYKLSLTENRVMVDDQPLILYHFHGLKRLNERIYNLGFSEYKERADHITKNHIYKEYIKWLKYASLEVSSFRGSQRIREISIRYRRVNSTPAAIIRSSRRRVKNFVKLSKNVFKGNILLIADKHIPSGK